jgi:hypothetical protein
MPMEAMSKTSEQRGTRRLRQILIVGSSSRLRSQGKGVGTACDTWGTPFVGNDIVVSVLFGAMS